MPAVRMFVAVEIPEWIRDEIREKLLRHIPEGSFKVVPRPNLHFTLLFIGWADDTKASEIKDRFVDIKFRQFEAELSGVGEFGGRVVWLGVRDGWKELTELAEKVSRTLGIPMDRPFSPHLTYAEAGVRKRKKRGTSLKSSARWVSAGSSA